MYLSIVIPAHNEAHRISQTLEEIRPYLCEHYPSHEVIVVDDGSRDDTVALVTELAGRYPQLRVLTGHGWAGKGAAIRRGVLDAVGEYVLYMDADHATPIAEIEKFLPLAADGETAIVGARLFQDDGSRFRRIVSLLCLLAAHLIVFRRGIPDSQCAFKLFPRRMARHLFSVSRTDGFMIDVELLHLIHRFGYRCRFVAVTWYDKPGSRVNLWRSLIVEPFELVRIWARGLAGVYEGAPRPALTGARA